MAEEKDVRAILAAIELEEGTAQPSATLTPSAEVIATASKYQCMPYPDSEQIEWDAWNMAEALRGLNSRSDDTTKGAG